jgi:hypothetical protein
VASAQSTPLARRSKAGISTEPKSPAPLFPLKAKIPQPRGAPVQEESQTATSTVPTAGKITSTRKAMATVTPSAISPPAPTATSHGQAASSMPRKRGRPAKQQDAPPTTPAGIRSSAHRKRSSAPLDLLQPPLLAEAAPSPAPPSIAARKRTLRTNTKSA